MLRAVALSKQTGLGIAEAQLQVMQPFFVPVDLPYSVIRGEQFPVKVALYNYQSSAEEFTVELEQADWFELAGPGRTKTVTGRAQRRRRRLVHRSGRRKLGTNKLKVTARSTSVRRRHRQGADRRARGRRPRDRSRTWCSRAGASQPARPRLCPTASSRARPAPIVAVTGSYLTQTIEGLEKLLQMPFGCGEQNMILFAPNVFVSRYLKETSQLKPEVMAKAEKLMITGYQRELTYRRARRQLLGLRRPGPGGQPLADGLRPEDLRPGRRT